MFHCPYCGIIVKEDENYCIKCGEQLPTDIQKRFKFKKRFNRFWYIPIAIITILLLLSVPFYLLLQSKSTQAKNHYKLGEESILNKEFLSAKEYFEQALTQKDNFYQAEVSLAFTKHALEIENYLNESSIHLDDNNFQEALSLVNEAENLLKNYHGQAATEMIHKILSYRNEINIEQINNQLEDQPTIETLKSLLWEAEKNNNDEADELTNQIRTQIIDYTFSKSNEKLNNNQFNDAQILVEDGLKYATDSEKLLSLQTTINKEKTAFEIAAQQRIEQAIHMAEEDRELNEQDAIKVEKVNVDWDDQDRLVVKGEVTSVATIPVHSILIEYTLMNRDTDLLTNKVFVYPEKLYPDETGKFEFTHYDINQRIKNIQININKVTWYTD